MHHNHQIRGIIPALVTPFKEDGSINYHALEKLVEGNLGKGVDGFYVGGSTAEVFLLSLDERKSLLETVARKVEGRAFVIAHIGCIATEHAIELGKHAAHVGADAVSSIPPFYYKFTLEEIKSFYLDIVSEVDLPMLLYNFPALSGFALSSENAAELFADPRIIGIKHTSMDLYQMERIKRMDPRLVVMNGHDEIFLAGLSMGADGAIGSTFNFMAERFIKIQKLYMENKLQEAQALQGQANDIIHALIEVGVFAGIKHALSLQGIETGSCRKPFKTLTAEQKKRLEEVLEIAHI